MKPKVSVIIPIYGVEKYIERCVRSLFSQSLDRIEFVFVDDCSPDRSILILRSLLEEYKSHINEMNWTTLVVNHKKNCGLPTARKTGYLHSSGEYIIHCDSDDWVDENIYKLLYEEAINRNLDIVWCDYYISDGNRHMLKDMSLQPRLLQGPIWNRLIRRSLYENKIIFPSENKAEDGALMTQLSFYAKARGHIGIALYYYYQNPNSMCHQLSEEASIEKLRQEKANTELKIEFLKFNSKVDEYKKDIIRWKYAVRNNVFHLIRNEECYRKWKNTYPELNIQFFISSGAPIREKLKFFLVLCRIYPLLPQYRRKYIKR